MSRTLRGFDTAFPYLGARGDVTDADVPDPGLVAKEEAYGGMYFDIGDRVASEMFGADDDDFSFGAHDFDDFGAHGFDDFGASHDQGAVNTMLEHRYGVQAPPGFTIGPMGQLVKVKAPPPPPPPRPPGRCPRRQARPVGPQLALHHRPQGGVGHHGRLLAGRHDGAGQPAAGRGPADGSDRQEVQRLPVQGPDQGRRRARQLRLLHGAPARPPIGGKLAGFTLKPLNRPA